MPITFPNQPDVRLANSPLAEVVCQVRFPPILRISNEDPTEFQERIRSRFPLVELEHGLLIQLPGPGAKGEPAAEPQTRIFRFYSPDRQTAISLAPDFYAVSTKEYVDWEGFANHLKLASRSMAQIYRPTFATRIGLRYINRFTKANTGRGSISEMLGILRPELTDHAVNETWGEAVQMDCRLVLSDDPAKLALVTKYASENGDPVFVLDLDYYEEYQQSLNGLVARCARYNDVIYRAFRWAIREDCFSIFDPVVKRSPK